MSEWIGPVPSGDELPAPGQEDEIPAGDDAHASPWVRMTDDEIREDLEHLRDEVRMLGKVFGGIQKEMDDWIKEKLSLANAALEDFKPEMVDSRGFLAKTSEADAWWQKWDRARNLNIRILQRCLDLGLIYESGVGDGRWFVLTPFGEATTGWVSPIPPFTDPLPFPGQEPPFEVTPGKLPGLGASDPLIPDYPTSGDAPNPELPPVPHPGVVPSGGGYRIPPVGESPASPGPDDPLPPTVSPPGLRPDEPPPGDTIPPVVTPPPPLKGVPLRLPKRMPAPGETIEPPPPVVEVEPNVAMTGGVGDGDIQAAIGIGEGWPGIGSGRLPPMPDPEPPVPPLPPEGATVEELAKYIEAIERHQRWIARNRRLR